MPLSPFITRQFSHPRKIACLSTTFGLIVFVLFVTIAMRVIWQQRSNSYDRLARDTQTYVLSVFDELKQALLPLRAVTQFSCSNINTTLTQRAAFTNNIRAILLVANNIAFCSSATGNMRFDIGRLSPETDIHNDIDIRLLPETPMVPGQPAIMLWLKDPHFPASGVSTTLETSWLLLAARQQEINGMAITAGKHALTTWGQQVIETRSLPAHPLRTIAIPGYPIQVLLYGTILPARDIHVILLTGLLLAVLSASGCFLLMMRWRHPDKEILLGIKRGEFHVEYQPVIEATTGKTYGLEALLRWTHPTKGRIPPDIFITYAEGQNLIVPLTRHLFELVARDAHRLCHVLPAGISMGLNLSPHHLSDNGFCKDVQNWLAAMPENHFNYIFEITERTMLNEHCAGAIFDWIHDQGVRIAIDDFGSGHSALIYLEKFKFDYLKIDRGFVQSIGLETMTSPVLETVLALAKKLNLRTVSEGVETWEQANWLLIRGVTHMQGYLFSRPCTVSQLIDYFQQEHAGRQLPDAFTAIKSATA